MLESPVSVPKILADSIPEILRTPWVNIKTETFLRWHQKGFQLFWRWKNRGREAGLACPGSPGNFEELREADKCPSNSERNIVWLPPLRAQTGSDVAQIFAPPELRKCPSRRRPAPFSHLGSTPLTGESPAAKDNPSAKIIREMFMRHGLYSPEQRTCCSKCVSFILDLHSSYEYKQCQSS